MTIAALSLIAVVVPQFGCTSPRPISQFASETVAPLSSYNVNIKQTSVSGVSSGAYMAVQFAVAKSSFITGVGAIAGGPYYCAQNSMNTALGSCMIAPPPSVSLLASTTNTWAAKGYIDPTSNIAAHKIWLFDGYNDGVVKKPVVDALYEFYNGYTSPGNIYYKDNLNAAHSQVTDSFGQSCNVTGGDFMTNCGYDAAGLILQHIYGSLNPRNSGTLSGTIIHFRQSDFYSGSIDSIAMDASGYAYVPASCAAQQPCRVHIAFHGCLQNAQSIRSDYYAHAGYNQWADSNNIIVLYPQTIASKIPFNPNGCWDWWGYSGSNYAQKNGPQIAVVRDMLTRLAAKYTGWSSVPNGPFGAPADVSALDSSTGRILLSWIPVGGATSYNVYRANCSDCSFRKVDSVPIHGTSYSDSGLLPKTTYFYQLVAVNASNVESARSTIVSRTTSGIPPSCDPYYRTVWQHYTEGRSWTAVLATFADGSNAYVGITGPSSLWTEVLLSKTKPGYFVVGQPCK